MIVLGSLAIWEGVVADNIQAITGIAIIFFILYFIKNNENSLYNNYYNKYVKSVFKKIDFFIYLC
jgi:succinate dehydrogenase/fumarate reductase cytochrome b subunit